ncbi:MAG: alanine--tRNA ligase [Hyphomonadaceae bacterium]|nr:alanine--tRNA ligase [Clostridia bacterium]
MKKLGLNEIREKYLAFFEGKGHLRLPSFPLVPQGDASLLLINAGMAPLKPYFTGKEVPPSKRVTTCQKCIRTPDIERVGKTARHGTFFEMLGNFSFGDYFKVEATAWAWEFITKTMEMPIDKLWVSIYEDDDEAFDIWTKQVGVSADHIVRLGKADNFWEIGTGPCGPCSEIYFDRGDENGCGSPDCAVGCDCDRFVEFWNLVFTQFDKDEAGNYNRLPKPNIDTGMGLERLAAIMQGVGNLFEVDTVTNIMSHITKIAGVQYKTDAKTDVSLRVITDHVRSTTMMVSDGILPSNEGRGYVLRRLLRRAARHGKLLGIQKPFLNEVALTVIEESKEAYPDLKEKQDFIQKVIANEEQRFDETIDAGLAILNQYIVEMKEQKVAQLSGDKAFKLYDTYGFPIDLTLEILVEQDFTADEQGFSDEMDAQRTRARQARAQGNHAGWDDNIFSQLDKGIKTSFIGYGQNACEAQVLALVKEDEIVQAVQTDEQVTVILDQTVFYGESGGQVGDIGTITTNNCTVQITDTKKLNDGKFLHIGLVTKGFLQVGDQVTATLDNENRNAIARNHSATHLLQKALKEILGSHVAQAGSYVNAERLRFDFNHFTAVTKEELLAAETAVNRMILQGLQVDINEMPIDDAKKIGAMALFGEKYGKTVRVVKMGDYSIELCGGCHVQNTSAIGLVKILSDSGVAAGVRRVEAVTGLGVINYLYEKTSLLEEAAQALKTTPNELPRRAEQVVQEVRDLQKELNDSKAKMAKSMLDDIVNTAKHVGDIQVVTARIDGMDADGLRQMGDMLRDKLTCGVVVLAAVTEGKINFTVMASKDAVAKGMHAGNIIKEVAKVAGGGGGGRPDIAQAGGKLPEKVDEALALVDGLVLGLLKEN